jgi:hypothetical protein
MNQTAWTCPDNQWPSEDFHRHCGLAMKDTPNIGLTPEEMVGLYLTMWLEISPPAGNA